MPNELNVFKVNLWKYHYSPLVSIIRMPHSHTQNLSYNDCIPHVKPSGNPSENPSSSSFPTATSLVSNNFLLGIWQFVSIFTHIIPNVQIMLFNSLNLFSHHFNQVVNPLRSLLVNHHQHLPLSPLVIHLLCPAQYHLYNPHLCLQLNQALIPHQSPRIIPPTNHLLSHPCIQAYSHRLNHLKHRE